MYSFQLSLKIQQSIMIRKLMMTTTNNNINNDDDDDKDEYVHDDIVYAERFLIKHIN